MIFQDFAGIGAITVKSISFSFRPWELSSTIFMDISNSFGINVRVDTRGLEVIRVLPYFNANLTSVWLPDKIRSSLQKINFNRVLNPIMLLLSNFEKELDVVSWQQIIKLLAKKLIIWGILQQNKGNFSSLVLPKKASAKVFIGPSTELEFLSGLRILFDLVPLAPRYLNISAFSALKNYSFRANYTFAAGAKINAGVFLKTYSAIRLIGVDFQNENPNLALEILKLKESLKANTSIYSVSTRSFFGKSFLFVGGRPENALFVIFQLVKPDNELAIKNLLTIFGESAFYRKDNTFSVKNRLTLFYTRIGKKKGIQANYTLSPGTVGDISLAEIN